MGIADQHVHTGVDKGVDTGSIRFTGPGRRGPQALSTVDGKSFQPNSANHSGVLEVNGNGEAPGRQSEPLPVADASDQLAVTATATEATTSGCRSTVTVCVPVVLM